MDLRSKLTAHNSGAKRDPSRLHEEPSCRRGEPRQRCDEPPRWHDEPHRRSEDPSHKGGGTEADSEQQHGHEHDVKAEAAPLSVSSTSAPRPVEDAEKEMLKKQLGEAKEKLGEAEEKVERMRKVAAHWKAQHGKLKEEADAAATTRLLALQEHLEQCRRITELLARNPKSNPKPLLVHWNLQISRRALVPDVLAQFGQLTNGAVGGKGPLQLWRNTVVTFVDAFGVEEPGIDQGGLTVELHATFWSEVFKPEHKLFEGDHGRYLPRARARDALEQHKARLRGLEATGRMLLKSIIDGHPTGRLLSRFVFEFLADSHERRVFLPSQPLEALRALEDFDPGLAKQWRRCVLEMSDEELSHLTLEDFEPSLGEGVVTRANVAEAVIAGCRSKLLLERQEELEALRRGFTFDSRMDLAMQLARSWVHIACPPSRATSRACPNSSNAHDVPERASGSPES